jgi:hypothetical protein
MEEKQLRRKERRGERHTDRTEQGGDLDEEKSLDVSMHGRPPDDCRLGCPLPPPILPVRTITIAP